MSRSNPTEHAPNPAVRWFEWNGGDGEKGGTLEYYDKTKKETVNVGTKFTFLLLDKLASIGGYNEAAKKGIYSNEVRDTTRDVLVVKLHKGETIAEGLYRDIKDHITSRRVGGYYVANLYIAFKLDDKLAIGSLRLKGAALNAWVEFQNAHRADINEAAVEITGYKEGVTGRVTFRTPVFGLKPVSSETNAQAIELDKTLQAWLKGYFARAKRESVPTNGEHERHDDAPPPDDPGPPDFAPDDDDIPF